MTRCKKPAIFLSALMCLCPLAAHAGEGGITHYMPGSTATLIDLLPTKPGWVVEGVYLNYQGSASAGKNFPVAGSMAAGLDATSNAVLAGSFYTFEPTMFGGAQYSVGVFLPFVSIEATANIDTPLGNVRRKDSVSGIGDITLIPLMLAWKSESVQFNVLVPVYAPTGQYEQGRLANPGLNYWTIDPTVGVSYNNAKTGINAALYAGIGFNTENNTTGYSSGSVLHFDGSVQKLIPVGKGLFGFGAEAFYVEQVSGDSGGNALLGDFKGRTVGIGPVFSFIKPLGKQMLVTELRWLPELNVKNRLEGDYIWLKAVYQF